MSESIPRGAPFDEELDALVLPEPKRRAVGRVIPEFVLQRLAELARSVRDPTNSAPLTELLDLLAEATDV